MVMESRDHQDSNTGWQSNAPARGGNPCPLSHQRAQSHRQLGENDQDTEWQGGVGEWSNEDVNGLLRAAPAS
jgi:hypothetical protein